MHVSKKDKIIYLSLIKLNKTTCKKDGIQPKDRTPYKTDHYKITDDYLIHENRWSSPILLLIFTSKYILFILASFPDSTVSPTVVSLLIDGPAYQIPNVESTPSLLPVFKCNFDDIPNVTYVYDVYWYINGNNVTS